eukprot:Pgem_evm1s12983
MTPNYSCPLSIGDTLRRARGRLEETDSELRKSSRVAMQMYRHILQNKAIVGVVG